MENVRRHMNVQLVHTTRRLKKLTAKPSYKTSKIFSEDLVAVDMGKNKVSLNKPSYCGMVILDLSKHLMYDLFDNKLKKRSTETGFICS